ncbi:hypothetical protein Q9252_11940 [Marinobacter salarius]|uniref:hypothetical protein n=1 Tax=Marinobacter salarius TaxID=1420917 RepID=UPI00273C3359|nr:hypothetical protein [Marinobacter salarius]MDP4532855.1 hypothetical protein [Marinobacter salarius]
MKHSHIISVKSLSETLDKATQDRRYRYKWLLESCKTQGSLAQTNKPDLNIIPMSLNTFKQYANTYIDGGFQLIDNLRRDVLEKAGKTKNTKQEKSDAISEKVRSLSSQLELAQKQKAVLQKAYFELNEIALEAIANSPHQKRLLDRHNELYDKYFSLRVVGDDE